MNQISLRIYVLICLLWMKLQTWAQDDLDEDDFTGTRTLKGDHFEELFEEMEQVPRIHIRFSDIVWTIIIIASCYVFGKIWKGCTYLIIFLVALYIMVFRMYLL